MHIVFVAMYGTDNEPRNKLQPAVTRGREVSEEKNIAIIAKHPRGNCFLNKKIQCRNVVTRYSIKKLYGGPVLNVHLYSCNISSTGLRLVKDGACACTRACVRA